MAAPLDDFDAFLEQRSAAAGAYVSGDATPLGRLLTVDAPATFFGPQGGVVRGALQVAASYVNGARAFKPDSQTQLEVLQSGASGDLAYWVGVQRAHVRLDGQAQPEPMALRVTEVFKREGGEWKLVHRHADSHVDTTPAH